MKVVLEEEALDDLDGIHAPLAGHIGQGGPRQGLGRPESRGELDL